MGTLTHLSVIASAALLGACATSYGPESAVNRAFNRGGYSESKRAPGVYQVWFVDKSTNQDRGEVFATLRAAELCLGENKPFMRTSNFQSGLLKAQPARMPGGTRSVRYGEPGSPYVPTPVYVPDVHTTPAEPFYTTRNALLVTCLPEKADDAQEAASVAASIRGRYRISTKSTRQKPSR